MRILVTYDINTEDKAGQKRLRKVAIVCKDYGQRAQKSVFECSVNEMQYDALLDRLLKIIDTEQDNLRLYRLSEAAKHYVESYGRNTIIDFDEPLII